jgi:hypothetical protein
VFIRCSGRFHPVKGQQNFVKPPTIVARTNTKVRFLLIGQGCGANNAKLRLAEKVWSSNHFVLLGDYKFALRSNRGDTVIMVLAQNEQALAQGLLE